MHSSIHAFMHFLISKVKQNIERLTVFILVLLTVFLIELQYIFGLVNTPAGTIYLGTVHYPPDYFYYLSQFIQGRENFLFSSELYTSENLLPVFIRWPNVLTGKILLSLGLGVITSYQIAVAIYLLLFLLTAYWLIKEVFPESIGKRILSFFFFVSSTSFFEFIKTANGLDISYIKFWYNLGIMQWRFGPTPHHLLAYSLSTILLLLLIKWYKSKIKTIKLIVALGITGFLLVTVSPVQWGLLLLSAISTGIIFSLIIHIRLIDFVKAGNWKSFLFPPFILLVFGLPGALYTKSMISGEAQSWEASQQIHLNFWILTLGSGLIIPFGFIGLIPTIKKLNIAKFILIIYLALGAFFYFSGIPAKFSLTNVRFWPSPVYIVLAALAATAVFYLAEKVNKIKLIIIIIIILIYIATIIPAHYAYEKEVLTPKIGNAYYYLPKDALETFKKTENLTGKNSLYLVQWPFNEPFPALTGRKSFYGSFLNTHNFWEKTAELFKLFDGKMSQDQAKQFIQSYKIDYVLVSSWNKNITGLPFIKEIYFNELLGIYKVELE